jgi:hypothetical protein
MRTLSILSVATFLVIGLASCDKEETAITPANDAIVQQNGVDEFEANPDDFTSATISDADIIEFGIESRVMFQVNQVFISSSSDALTYDLRGRGEGNSPNYGPAIVRMRLQVNGETGEARGYVNYAFEEAGINIRFRLQGYLNTGESPGYSVLISRLIPNQTNGLEAPSGRGKTYIFSDLFQEMQLGGSTPIHAEVVTKALITE